MIIVRSSQNPRDLSLGRFSLRCHTEPFSETAERAPRPRVVGLSLVVGQVATIMMSDED